MAGKQRRIWIVAFALAGVVGLGVLAYVLQRNISTSAPLPGVQQAKPGGGDAKPAAVAVEVVRVGKESFTDVATAVGSIKSNESVVLRPEISGRIARILFKEGEVVQRGALLLALDAGIQEAELRQAEANLKLAKANQARNQDLFEKKFVSEQALDNTRANLGIQAAAVELARAKLAKTRIHAPFAGIVGIRSVSVGDYVKEGQDLVNLEDIATLKVDFRLPESYLGRLQPGLKLEVISDTLPGLSFDAVLDAVDPLVDPNGRAVVCRALLPNNQGKLRPGMFARVRLVFGTREDALMIPEQAVVTGNKTTVFVVNEGKVSEVPVRLGVRRDARVEVLEGLQVGDVIVTAGQLKLRHGMPVRMVGEAQGSMQGMAGMQPVNRQ